MDAVKTRPMWGDLRSSGGGANISIIYPNTEEPPENGYETLASAKVYAFADRQLQDAKSYRKLYDTKWNDWYNAVRGQQWQQATSMGGGRMMRWRARLNINYMYGIIDGKLSAIYDNDPRLSLTCTSQEQMPYVECMQGAMDQLWYDEQILSKARDASFNSFIYGVGYLKPTWDPSADNGLGRIRVSVVPSENLYVDRNATSFADAKSVFEVERVPLSQLREMFPKAANIRPEGVGSYAQDKREGNLVSPASTNTSVDKLYSPPYEEDQPRIADKTSFSVPPWKSISGRTEYLVEVSHLWIRDQRTKKTVNKQYVAGYDQFGRPVVAMKQETVLAFPQGRLITIAGGEVLQDVANPYPVFPPYVLFRDIVWPGEFYGQGDAELLFDLQAEFNKRRAQITDHATLMGNATYIVDDNSGIAPSMIMNAPGLIIKKKQGSEVRRESPPEMPSYIMAAERMPVNDMMFISGAGGLGGGTPKGARSGSAMQEGQAIQTQRVRRIGKNVETALVELGRMLIAMIQRFYTTPRMVRILGNYGKSTSFVPFDNWHARGQWDIRVEAGSAIAASKTARRQEAIQLFGMKVIDEQNLLEVLEWPDKEGIMRRKGMTGPPVVPIYPGWPGLANPQRSDNSGYALSVRASQQQAPPPAPGAPIQAPPPTQGGKPPKPRKPKGSAAPALYPFGSPIGGSKH